jgi:hypothetical protein
VVDGGVAVAVKAAAVTGAAAGVVASVARAKAASPAMNARKRNGCFIARSLLLLRSAQSLRVALVPISEQ